MKISEPNEDHSVSLGSPLLVCADVFGFKPGLPCSLAVSDDSAGNKLAFTAKGKVKPLLYSDRRAAGLAQKVIRIPR